jgi:hypothetical protein
LGQRFHLRDRRQARSALSRRSAARRLPPSSVVRRACLHLHRNGGHRIFVVAAESSRELAVAPPRELTGRPQQELAQARPWDLARAMASSGRVSLLAHAGCARPLHPPVASMPRPPVSPSSSRPSRRPVCSPACADACR